MKKTLLILLLNCAIIAGYSQSCIQLAQNYFSCGIPSNEFNYMRANSINQGDQIQSNWCWAACVQMVLNYHGLSVSQIDVVTRIYGSPYVNQPANEAQILNALSGWAADYRGRYSAIYAQGGFSNLQEIVNNLSAKWPLIVGLSNPQGGVGHACVLTAIYYSNQYDYYGNIIGIIPTRVTIRDPWPTNPSPQELSWSEFQQRAFMILKVWVSRL